jgi:hypothetical protein
MFLFLMFDSSPYGCVKQHTQIMFISLIIFSRHRIFTSGVHIFFNSPTLKTGKCLSFHQFT